MKEKQFYYSPFLVIGMCIIYYLCVLLPCIFMFLRAQNLLMLFFIAFIMFFTYPRVICFTRALIRLVNKRPAITLTDQYFIDHYYGVKIEWANVNAISRVYYRWTFCAFDLFEPVSVYRQIKDPVIMVAVKLDSYFPRASFKTVLSIVDGRDMDVYDEIARYRSQLISN